MRVARAVYKIWDTKIDNLLSRWNKQILCLVDGVDSKHAWSWKYKRSKIDDAMTSGMLNSFNSGAFQISCLRWTHWRMMMVVLTLTILLTLKVYQHLHRDCSGLQRASPHPVRSRGRRLRARPAQEAGLQVWKPEWAAAAGACHLGPELHWGMWLAELPCERRKGMARNLCGVE